MISDVVYNEIDWISCNRENRFLLYLIIQGSQRGLAVKIDLIGDMSIETFKTVTMLLLSSIKKHEILIELILSKNQRHFSYHTVYNP